MSLIMDQKELSTPLFSIFLCVSQFYVFVWKMYNFIMLFLQVKIMYKGDVLPKHHNYMEFTLMEDKHMCVFENYNIELG